MNNIRNHKNAHRASALLLGALLTLTSSAADDTKAPEKLENNYPAASHVPDSQKGWEKFQTNAENDAPMDEPMGGHTAAGSPVNVRRDDCFPAETRNIFSEVDKVFDETTGQLEPFDYRNGEYVDKEGRNAVRGQNTWMLWAEGNEAFWNWLQQHGYGLADFMVLLDSRTRGSRFERAGMINQPGMKSNSVVNELGLYLDVADGDKGLMTQPPYDLDAKDTPAKRPEAPAGNHADESHTEVFKPYDREAYQRIIGTLAQDGVDYNVYGYPSGVIGLRLFPNPDFFGTTDAAGKARDHWEKTVKKNPDAYYANGPAGADPTLVRPFRVGMSCAFCHVGPHPLNPPTDPEKPEWANLSSVIGNQYWTTEKIFANLLQAEKRTSAPKEDLPSFLRQFLASQQPGTIDTSLVSTDHINNANTIISVFDLPARLQRANSTTPGVPSNSPETQGQANLLLKSVEEVNPAVNPRHTPRILVDGSDSVGAYGALARVYLNIGTHPDQWARCHNPVIGFKPQKPFSIATLKAKSVYWNAADKYRIPALASFFTHLDTKKNKYITSPMKLKHARDVETSGADIIAAESQDAAAGRTVFVDNCAICHSSKQPVGFDLKFSRDWSKAAAPKPEAMQLTLPSDFPDWKEFKLGKAYQAYLAAIRDLEKNPQDGKDFLENNFLSSEVRIPVTLVGTNSGRAVATNAMRGQVWDNFSSETYKQLEAVGPVRFFNPYSNEERDAWGNNDYYFPPEGGPGYYRPASLISLWATAPYLHNNVLGIFTHNPSIKGRLAAFDDGIDRLFDHAARLKPNPTIAGDMRAAAPLLAGGEAGLIYRTTEETQVAFNGLFVKPLLVGLLGDGGLSFITSWLWGILAGLFLILALFGRARQVGFFFVLLAVISAIFIVIGRFDRIAWWLWLVPAVAVGIALIFFLVRAGKLIKAVSRLVFVAIAAGSIGIGYLAHGFVEGKHGGIALGPIPKGTPVNLVMNMNPEAPLGKTLRGATALVRGMILSKRETTEANKLRVFEEEAGKALLEASKCPDFVLDRGHWFAEDLSADEKRQLKAFLKTL